jgi:hypothetical protein
MTARPHEVSGSLPKRKRDTRKGRVKVTSESFTPWGEFDPIEYASRNYGQTALLEDREITIAGIGGALVSPALSATHLDSAEPQHQSRVMGIRGSVAAPGEVVGPLLVAVVSLWTTLQGIFAISGAVTLVAVFLTLAVLKGRSRTDLHKLSDKRHRGR